MTRYWLGVVSKEHVERGVKGGFIQVCHGKREPLTKIKKGDGFIYYSPKISMNGKEACKSFTAIGNVKTGDIYQVEMAEDFHPFRMDLVYFSCKDAPISNFMDKLDLTKRKNWGMQLRRGLVEITEKDFQKIALEMGANL